MGVVELTYILFLNITELCVMLILRYYAKVNKPNLKSGT